MRYVARAAEVPTLWYTPLLRNMSLRLVSQWQIQDFVKGVSAFVLKKLIIIN